MAKRVVVENIKARDTKRFGVVRPGAVAMGHHAEILVGESVRLYGVSADRSGSKEYTKTFKVGDTATYDSYNLVYTGKIVTIGEKTVSIKEEFNETVHRLDLHEFSWRNRAFNLDEVREQNHETMRHI